MDEASCVASLMAGPGALADKALRRIDAANERGGCDSVSVIPPRQAHGDRRGRRQRLMRRVQGE